MFHPGKTEKIVFSGEGMGGGDGGGDEGCGEW